MEKQNEQEINELKEPEIKDLIIKFNLDSSIDKLKEYYSTKTTWEIIGKSRSETCHTQFLAWFFGNKDFNANPNTGPIKKLIVLLLKWWAKYQNEAQFNNDLANSIYSQSFKIIEYEVTAEEEIELPDYGKGEIDIFIECKAMVNGEEKNINIVIENKIDAPETTKCFDNNGKLLKKPNKENTENTLYQTEAYYDYVSKEYKDDINLFVYLKPTYCNLKDITKAECACKAYIQINYQELLDNIIQPSSEQKDISVENRYRLKDYIKTLGTPSKTEEETEDTENDKKNKSNKKITIMAMGQNEKELLKTFFYENEDLIRAAINALGNKKLSEEMANVESNKRYELSYKEYVERDIAKAKVAFEAIKMLKKDGKKPKDIEEILGKSGAFWEKVEEGKKPTAGYTAEISFSNGEKYLVHTQRYKTTTKTFKNLVKVLRDAGFSCN